MRKRIVEADIQYSTINIYHPDTNELRELYRQRFAAGRGEVDAIPDSIHCRVYGEYIYIEQSTESFKIAVYDKTGTLVSTFNPKVRPIRMKQVDKDQALQTMKEDPLINMNGWENYKNSTRFHFPAYLPTIRDFVVVDNRVIVQTYQKREETEEYIFLDEKGNIEKRLFLPMSEKPVFTEEMMGTGVKYFAFTKESYYRLLNEEDGCELERVPLVR